MGLILFSLAHLYLPETRGLVFGGPVEKKDKPSVEEQLKAVSECLRDREWRQSQYVERHGEIDIPVESVWRFVDEQEVVYELWKHRQSAVGFERLRPARVDIERLVKAISEQDTKVGVEVFRDRQYLLTVDKTSKTSIHDSDFVSASGPIAGPSGQYGDWRITVNISSGEVIGTLDASDSWTQILTGTEDRSLTVFAEIDQCERQQRLRGYSF